MKRALLIGNGINRLTRGEKSWPELLKEITFFAGDGPMAKPSEFKPLPLFLEEIILRKQGTYDVILMNAKNYIYAVLSGLRPNAFHHLVINSKIKHILTTNYDYGFEKCFKPNYINHEPGAEQTLETKHSIKRKKNLPNNKILWHIHGEISQVKGLNKSRGDYKAKSIMIGYDHYSEYLTEIQNFIAGRRTRSAQSLMKRIEEGLDEPESWIDIFFTHDIVICGLDLSFYETNLWWLLNYRAININNSIYSGKQGFRNKITFVYPDFPDASLQDLNSLDEVSAYQLKRKQREAKLQIFGAMHVEAEPIKISISNDYESFYNHFIEKYLNDDGD